MNLPAFVRVLAFFVLAALFISDYMFNMWAKDIPREAYLLVISLALGIDTDFLRSVIIGMVTKSLGIGETPKDDE